MTSRTELRAWLAENHDRSAGIWLVRFKKGRGPNVTYDEVVEEALCVGWVDSLPRSLDDDRSMLLLTPRKPASAWSAANKARIEKLTAAGLMTPAGEAVVEAAKASGRWNAIDDADALVEPPDLAAALDAAPQARANWDAFPRSVRRPALEQLLAAKTEATRSKRLTHIVEESAAGRRPFQWRPKV